MAGPVVFIADKVLHGLKEIGVLRVAREEAADSAALTIHSALAIGINRERLSGRGVPA
jgi:hypothetical protein